MSPTEARRRPEQDVAESDDPLGGRSVDMPTAEVPDGGSLSK
jgi:hypothetical protein